MTRKNSQRLVLELSPELVRRFKVTTFLNKVTMRDVVEELITTWCDDHAGAKFITSVDAYLTAADDQRAADDSD